MANVILENVTKTYPGELGSPDKVAVKNASFEVGADEFVVLVGPSGCGKTTTLRMIAGLETVTSGSIYLDGKRINDILPKNRDLAMVFQNYALYPHMTVYRNMAFGLQLRKVPRAEIDRRVNEAAETLGLLHPDNLLHRKPRALSGGQRQRVALGRAIVRQPKAFLFDEPLSNLDAKMRVETRTEISKLHMRLRTTMIYVTHDQVEAMTMADRIVVLNNGEVQQIAEPLTLYNQPANTFVAGFMGSPSMNFIKGTLRKDSGQMIFEERKLPGLAKDTPPLRLVPLEEQARKLDAYLDREVIFGVRPEDLEDRLFLTNADPDHIIHATIDVIEPMGAETFLYLNTAGHSLIARSHPMQGQNKSRVGQEVELVADMAKCHFFDATTTQTII